MPTPSELIHQAFAKLTEQSGYTERPDQLQAALIISDMIESEGSVAIEAPTGLGKSLACLIPALVHASFGKRIAVATYTNVLSLQYWNKDLPLAKSLLSLDPFPDVAFLIGRQRYVCLAAIKEHVPHLENPLLFGHSMGLENDFKDAFKSNQTSLMKPNERDSNAMWQKVVTPPTCSARQCPEYNNCFYYNARKDATEGALVITNHAVIIQNAILSRGRFDAFDIDANEDEDAPERATLLGELDFIILDEAHDFPQAATNGLEFEMGPKQIESTLAAATRIERALELPSRLSGNHANLLKANIRLRESFHSSLERLEKLAPLEPYGGILGINPESWADHPAVKEAKLVKYGEEAIMIAESISIACMNYHKDIESIFTEWKDEAVIELKRLQDLKAMVQNHRLQIREIGFGANSLSNPPEGCVSYLGVYRLRDGTLKSYLRNDVVDLKKTLKFLIWDALPYACVSATLAVDGSFEFFSNLTGATFTQEEILPSPFDFTTQAALYIPPAGRIPDPSVARKEKSEDQYYRAVANEVESIIRACQGRTLVLFHSRKEMNAVRSLIDLPLNLPIFIQSVGDTAKVGKEFRENISSSLFAVRSFWTGFDAPGETCSCVILVRIPFEIPTEPPQLARVAMMAANEQNAFTDYALPQTKMMLRQGAGRLIRSTSDRGIIALLDPRLHTKRYGEEIIANMPEGIQSFSSLEKIIDAALLP